MDFERVRLRVVVGDHVHLEDGHDFGAGRRLRTRIPLAADQSLLFRIEQGKAQRAGGFAPSEYGAHEVRNEQNRGDATTVVIDAGRMVHGRIVGTTKSAGCGRIEMRGDEDGFVAFSRQFRDHVVQLDAIRNRCPAHIDEIPSGDLETMAGHVERSLADAFEFRH